MKELKRSSWNLSNLSFPALILWNGLGPNFLTSLRNTWKNVSVKKCFCEVFVRFSRDVLRTLDFQPLTVFTKSSILDVWQGSEHTSAHFWNDKATWKSFFNQRCNPCRNLLLRAWWQMDEGKEKKSKKLVALLIFKYVTSSCKEVAGFVSNLFDSTKDWFREFKSSINSTVTTFTPQKYHVSFGKKYRGHLQYC